MSYLIGCDPGLDGAFVVLKDRSIFEVKKMPLLKVGKKIKIDELALVELIQYLAGFPGAKIILEHLSNTPGKQGTFSFGDGYGLIRGMFLYAKKEITYVRPRVWKDELMRGMPAQKVASCVAAARYFPGCRKHLVKPRGGLDDGIADALLIAEWGRRNLVA